MKVDSDFSLLICTLLSLFGQRLAVCRSKRTLEMRKDSSFLVLHVEIFDLFEVFLTVPMETKQQKENFVSGLKDFLRNADVRMFLCFSFHSSSALWQSWVSRILLERLQGYYIHFDYIHFQFRKKRIQIV